MDQYFLVLNTATYGLLRELVCLLICRLPLIRLSVINPRFLRTELITLALGPVCLLGLLSAGVSTIPACICLVLVLNYLQL